MQSVDQWLSDLGLEQYATVFDANDIGLDVLPELTDTDLQQLGVSLGHRKRILAAVRQFNSSVVPVVKGTSKTVSSVESLTADGERRQVTVLFCDLVGSTSLSNALDPEEYRKVLARYHEACIACVQRFEGYVAQIQGDGVVSYFGYPLAHEGEAERAIRAGLSVLQAIASLDVGLGTSLSIRLGAASGLVVVSHVLARDKSAVGETPNLAARLQTLAQPGELLVSEHTRRLAGGAFEYADRGEHALKGIPEPARVWQVLGTSEVASRFEAATRSGVTPMVGREQEVALLLDRWDLACTGEGQVVLLRGEPGIGKSRMLRAFRERVGKSSAVASQFQCSPYSTNSAFYPFVDYLERELRFTRVDGSDERLDKMEAFLSSRAPVKVRAGAHPDGSQLLARLLAIPCDARYGSMEMSPERQKNDTIRMLVDLMVRPAAQEAVVILFEDAHWADPTTIEVLSALVDRVERMRILVLITFRPEFDPPWMSRAQVTLQALSRLSRAQGANIVLRVAGKPMPQDLVDQIVEKTDGVPLFLEELAKAVLESKMLVEMQDRFDYSGKVDKLEIPNTLRDSLMARLDRLIPVKEIAQIGACLGREFSYELVRAVSSMSESSLQDALAKFTASELVFRRGTGTEAVYIFKHALVQDAAYDSLLKSKRQALHAQIAQAILARFPGTADAQPELLAHHFTEAGMYGEAIGYCQQAGQLARQRVAHQEAIGHFQRGLELTENLPPSRERDAHELRLRALLGMAWVALMGYTHPQVEAQLAPALRLDPALDDGDYMVRILWGLWVYRLCSGQMPESLRWAHRLLSTSEAMKDETMRIVGHWEASDSTFFLGDMAKCIEHADALLALYDSTRHERIADLVNHDPKTIALMYRAGAEWMLGYPEKAVATAEMGIANCDAREHPFDRCWARHFSVLFVFGPCGYFERADTLIAEMDVYATEQSLLFFTQVLGPMKRALCDTWSGGGENAFDTLAAALNQWNQAGMKVAVPNIRATLAETALRCNRYDEAMAQIEDALTYTTESKEQTQALAEVLRVKALAFQAQGLNAQAEAYFQEALAVAQGQGAKSWELRVAMDLARFYATQGERGKGLSILQPVHAWFTEGHATKDLREAATLIVQLGTQ